MKRTETRTSKFDVAEYLNTPEIVAEYLSQIIEDGDLEELIEALGDIARAQGMSKIAKRTGLGRESLYKSLRAGKDPRVSTLKKVLGGLGLSLRVVPEKRVATTA